MMITDLAISLAFAVFLTAWIIRKMPGRTWILLGAAAALLIASIWAYLISRWQAQIAIAVGIGFVLIALFTAFKKSGSSSKTPYISGVILLLAAAASMYPILTFPVGQLPAPTGPHMVGTRSFELVDTNRMNIQNAGEDAARRLLVKVWYPAQDLACQPVPYFTPQEADTTARSLGTFFGRPKFLTHLRHVQTRSCKDASILKQTGAPRPTILYSHGYVMFAGQHVTLMEDLASHGYIIYAIQHTRDSSTTVFPNGDVVDMDPRIFYAPDDADIKDALDLAYSGETYDDRLEGLLSASTQWLEDQGRFAQSRKIWVDDRLFVHNQLAEGKAPKSMSDIVRASDFSKIGQMGMSYGGSTTGAICLVDTRCAAAVNLDGFDYHLKAINADMPVPFLMLHADTDMVYASANRPRPAIGHSFNDFAYERFEGIGLNENVTRIELRGAFHLGMSDLPLFLRGPIRNAFVGSTPKRHFVQAQNRLVRDFFDTYLRLQDVDYPNAAIDAHKGWLNKIDNAAIRTWWLAKPERERHILEQRIKSVTTAEN
ncbi:MAG: hypothetical protein ACFBZ9_04780 [Sphingomonadales bacterium]